MPRIPEQPQTQHQASLGFTFLLCEAVGCLELRECRLRLTEGQGSKGEWELGPAWGDVEGRDLGWGGSASPHQII